MQNVSDTQLNMISYAPRSFLLRRWFQYFVIGLTGVYIILQLLLIFILGDAQDEWTSANSLTAALEAIKAPLRNLAMIFALTSFVLFIFFVEAICRYTYAVATHKYRYQALPANFSIGTEIFDCVVITFCSIFHIAIGILIFHGSFQATDYPATTPVSVPVLSAVVLFPLVMFLRLWRLSAIFSFPRLSDTSHSILIEEDYSVTSSPMSSKEINSSLIPPPAVALTRDQGGVGRLENDIEKQQLLGSDHHQQNLVTLQQEQLANERRRFEETSRGYQQKIQELTDNERELQKRLKEVIAARNSPSSPSPSPHIGRREEVESLLIAERARWENLLEEERKKSENLKAALSVISSSSPAPQNQSELIENLTKKLEKKKRKLDSLRKSKGLDSSSSSDQEISSQLRSYDVLPAFQSPSRTVASSSLSPSLPSEASTTPRSPSLLPTPNTTEQNYTSPAPVKLAVVRRPISVIPSGKPNTGRTTARNLIANELLSTEKSYVKHLGILVSVFLEPLKRRSTSSSKRASSVSSDSPSKRASSVSPSGSSSSLPQLEEGDILTSGEIQLIFGVIETIYKHNQALADLLDQRIASSPWSDDTSTIGDLFNAASISIHLQGYEEYCFNYQSAVDSLNKAMSQKPAFAEFLEVCESKPEVNKLTLLDFLIMPIQRVPRYAMLLKELSKRTTPEHPDSAPLEQALVDVKKLADKINDIEKTAENLNKIALVQQRLKEGKKDKSGGKFQIDQLLIPGRKYVGEGKLSVLKGGSKKKKKRYFFVFSDLLLETQSESKTKKVATHFLKSIVASPEHHPPLGGPSSSSSSLPGHPTSSSSPFIIGGSTTSHSPSLSEKYKLSHTHEIASICDTSNPNHSKYSFAVTNIDGSTFECLASTSQAATEWMAILRTVCK